MKFNLSDGRTGQAIGDPHFGLKFEVGVPLSKRGIREASQMRDFRSQLNEDVDVCIVVGDVFEHPYVPYEVVDRVASALSDAAKTNPDCIYIVYAGNHDLPRDITKVGAFHDLVDRLHGRYPNLTLARRPMVVNNIAIFPWEWDRRSDEQVNDLAGQKIVAAFGHWDLVLFDKHKDEHLAPTREIVKAFGKVPMYSGHIHIAGDYKINGHVVTCTGSLQPYDHGQDPNSTLYVTEALSDVLAKPEGYYKDKMLRVVLQPGEVLPDVEALALTPKRVVAEKADKITVSLGDFNWKKILSEAINKMPDEVKKFTLERMPYVNTAEQRGSSD
jgi:predicted phosphodiesterase